MNQFRFITYKYDNELEGEFVWEKPYLKLFDSYYDASEIYESGNFQRAIRKFRYILKMDSRFFPALSDIGGYYLEKHNVPKAMEYYSKAYKIASNEIPKKYNGKILWGIIENRHYLRTLYGYGLSCIYSLNYKKALEIFEKILKYNPNDNQGIRYYIGDIHFLLGNYSKAEIFYKENLDSPIVRYSYGLLLFKFHRFTESIVQLSLGIIYNGYIYKSLVNEILNEEVTRYNAYDIEGAISYSRITFTLWHFENGARLLKQIYNSDIFNLYYEQIILLRKKIKNIKGSTNEDIKNRSKYINRVSELISIIDSDFALKLYNEINQIKS